MQPTQDKKATLIDVFRRLAEMPAFLCEYAGRMPGDLQRWRPADDDWSLVEQVCHLRDLEIEGYGVRIARLVSEDVPALDDFDGARVARERDYLSRSMELVLDEFSSARAANLQRVADLASTELQRKGMLEGVGEITLEQLLSNMCEHDDEHRCQVTALFEKFLSTA